MSDAVSVFERARARAHIILCKFARAQTNMGPSICGARCERGGPENLVCLSIPAQHFDRLFTCACARIIDSVQVCAPPSAKPRCLCSIRAHIYDGLALFDSDDVATNRTLSKLCDTLGDTFARSHARSLTHLNRTNARRRQISSAATPRLRTHSVPKALRC